MEKTTTSRRTKTTSFGVNGRTGHDASAYYARAIAGSPLKGGMYIENKIPSHLQNTVIHDDVTSPSEGNRLPDESVHLMVTSPPYCVGKDYDSDMTLDEYLTLLRAAWVETERVLVTGGRVCINIANIGRKPYIPLHAFVIKDMTDLGLHMRGEIIWDKGASGGGSCAWGSWKSASNPCLRDEHEYILVFCKGDYKRQPIPGRDSTLSRDAFLECTRSIWRMSTESAKRVSHPAPFPVELPRRCIELYTYDREVVFDPFMGSGTTGVAAIQQGRNFVGYEINNVYADNANCRIAREVVR